MAGKHKIDNLTHYCYIIENDVNNKVYIGVTYKPLEQRLKEHIKVAECKSPKLKHNINFAIAKHGREHFSIRLLEKFDSKKIAYEAEIKYISAYNSKCNGYNETNGGDCGPCLIQLDTQDVIGVIEDYCTEQFSIKELAGKYKLEYHQTFDITRLRISPEHNIPKVLLEKLKFIKDKSNKRKRLTQENINGIMKDFIDNDISQKDLAAKHNISVPHLCEILNGTFRHKFDIDKDLLFAVSEKLLNDSTRWRNKQRKSRPRRFIIHKSKMPIMNDNDKYPTFCGVTVNTTKYPTRTGGFVGTGIDYNWANVTCKLCIKCKVSDKT